METRIAKTFLKVAELGNITKAAEQLGYSQAAVTVQIRQLEQDLGVALFDRIGRGIQLTDMGRDFREYAVRLIKASDEADSFGIKDSDPKGKLVIEAHSSVAIGILPNLIPQFRKQYPGIKLMIRVSEDVDTLIDNIRQNRSDFAILFDRQITFEGCIKATEREEPFGFVAAASDPITKRKKVPLEEILDDSYISGFVSSGKGEHYDYLVEKSMSNKGLEVNPTVEIGTLALIAKILQHGWGRAFLPLFLIKDELERGELALIDTASTGVSECVQMFYCENRWISPVMKAFISYFQEQL